MRVRMELKVYGDTLSDIKESLQNELKLLLTPKERESAGIEIEVKNSDEEALGDYVGHCFIRLVS